MVACISGVRVHHPGCIDLPRFHQAMAQVQDQSFKSVGATSWVSAGVVRTRDACRPARYIEWRYSTMVHGIAKRGSTGRLPFPSNS
jgi:hypothetical protein